MQEQGKALGSYDGRVKADEVGIAGEVDPSSGANNPTLTAVGGVYTAMWNVYLNEELKYTTISSFMDSNDETFKNWDFSHVDPTGAHNPSINPSTPGQITLYTAGDLLHLWISIHTSKSFVQMDILTLPHHSFKPS